VVAPTWCFRKGSLLFAVLADVTDRFVWYRFRWVSAWARIHLGGPRQCLRVDIFPDIRHFATSNGNGENPIVLERLICGFNCPLSDADDQNPVSLRYVFGGLCRSFNRFG